MRARPSKLMTVTATVLCTGALVSACEAKVYGTPPPPPESPQLTVIAPLGNSAPLPETPPDQPTAAFDGLDMRIRQATAEAARSGADITVAILDRNTGQLVTNGAADSVAIASVVKLFIADDLLLQEA